MQSKATTRNDSSLPIHFTTGFLTSNNPVSYFLSWMMAQTQEGQDYRRTWPLIKSMFDHLIPAMETAAASAAAAAVDSCCCSGFSFGRLSVSIALSSKSLSLLVGKFYRLLCCSASQATTTTTTTRRRRRRTRLTARPLSKGLGKIQRKKKWEREKKLRKEKITITWAGSGWRQSKTH